MPTVKKPMKWCRDHDVRWWDESCPASREECNESCEVVVLMTRAEFIASANKFKLKVIVARRMYASGLASLNSSDRRFVNNAIDDLLTALGEDMT